MRVYKPEGTTHCGYNEVGNTIWYKRWSDGSWSVWSAAQRKWVAMRGTPAVAVRPILVDTGANQ